MKKVQIPQIRTPQFLNHLYRDLRDRRLLLPAAALSVALILVPVALSSSPATTAPPPPPAATAGGTQAEAATTPAVLAEQLGVTDYRKRLERLQSKNPFKRQYTAAPPSAQPETSSSATSSASATSSSAVTEPSASTTFDSTPTSPTTPPASTTPLEPPEPTLLVFKADLTIGPPGELDRRRHVELGKFLPSEAKPVVGFIGVTQDMKHALFVVSEDVSSLEGDGTCVPRPNNCNLLRLKVGKEAKLAYAPEGDRNYQLRLHGIELAPFDAKAAGKRGKRGSIFALAAHG